MGEDELGMGVFEKTHRLLQRPNALLTHSWLGLPKSLLREMVSRPYFSRLTLHIHQHKCVRKCTKKLFAID